MISEPNRETGRWQPSIRSVQDPDSVSLYLDFLVAFDEYLERNPSLGYVPDAGTC
jgi:hypothetical protein